MTEGIELLNVILVEPIYFLRLLTTGEYRLVTKDELIHIVAQNKPVYCCVVEDEPNFSTIDVYCIETKLYEGI